MGWRIVKKPNSQLDEYHIWSTVVDDFIYKDLSKYEVAKIYAESAHDRAMENIINAFCLEAEGRPSGYFDDYDEIIQLKREMENE